MTTTPSLEMDLEKLSAAADKALRREASVVTLDAPPREVLREATSRGLLERAYLMLQHEGSHPCVAVRPRNDNGGSATVLGTLEDDHRRLDAMVERIRLSGGRDRAEISRLASDFHYGLRRHIRIEEELLFPIFESRSGMGHQGPTQVMRMEHRAIEQELTRIESFAAALVRSEVGAWDGLFDALRAIEHVLGPHNLKEERILYPMIDEALEIDDAADVMARLVCWP